MLGLRKRSAAASEVLLNIQAWTRQRFKLREDAPVLVCEVACRLPLCPPLETAIAFWDEVDVRHQFRLYKSMGQVRYDDIGWLFALPESEKAGWDCC